VAGPARTLVVFPPADGEADDAWHSPGGLAEDAFLGGMLPQTTLNLLREWETLAPAASESPQAFEQALRIYHDHSVAAARALGAYDTIPLEVTFYRLGFFRYALMLFVLSFVVVALSWLKPESRVAWGASVLSVIPPAALLVAGITMRCVIRGRPPVTTLYETILFVTAVAVVVGLIVELMNRRRIAVAVAAALGLAGMFLANRYEAKEAVDTMPAVIAVLDTNFWLATHVTTVTMGYSAGLLAAAIAHLYIFARFFGVRLGDETYESLTRMAYGILCFGLLFSLVGTVLGGIWAAQSWGRFWGWDPKENGALMIVLCKLAILHARKGRLIQDMGLHLASVFTGMVVAFSWWGVNLLGVGLHSYGFTSGVMRVLATFLIVQTAVIALGAFAWARDEGLLAPRESPET
jgi:ABC-type transport system involved in cytochrome c biogenesis permease subunit